MVSWAFFVASLDRQPPDKNIDAIKWQGIVRRKIHTISETGLCARQRCLAALGKYCLSVFWYLLYSTDSSKTKKKCTHIHLIK